MCSPAVKRRGIFLTYGRSYIWIDDSIFLFRKFVFWGFLWLVFSGNLLNHHYSRPYIYLFPFQTLLKNYGKFQPVLYLGRYYLLNSASNIQIYLLWLTNCGTMIHCIDHLLQELTRHYTVLIRPSKSESEFISNCFSTILIKIYNEYMIRWYLNSTA